MGSRSRSRSRRRLSSRDSSSSYNKKGGYSRKDKAEIFFPGRGDPLISFREFYHVQPQNSNVNYETLEKYYENYKKEFEKDQIKIFFEEHKTDTWFIEKYDPIVSYQIYKNTIEEIGNIAKKFFEK